MTDGRKVQIAFTSADLARIETLRLASNRRTVADVVRDALRLYDWMRRQHAESTVMTATKDNKTRELVLPFEETAR